MKLKNLLGLKYPDDYIIRMFFKLGMHLTKGQVIEFGCGNGNNLLLFQEYGWDVSGIGIDIDKEALVYAKYNLADDHVDQLLLADLSKGVPDLIVDQFDALLYPNVNYYLPRSSFVECLKTHAL